MIGNAVNNWKTTLSTACTDIDTTITLDSVTGLPPTGVLTFTDTNEIVHYTSISGNDLTVERGYDNTTATAHDAGCNVAMRIIAEHYNGLKDEIVNHETDTNNPHQVKVEQDTAPKLGGDLNMNGHLVGGNSEADLSDAVAKKHTSGSETLVGDVLGTVNNNTVDNVGGVEASIIADAANKRHSQNTDQYLDYGGSNQVAVADVKDAVNKRHTHSNKSLLDSYDQTNANIKDAVNKRHTQNTDTALGAQTQALNMNSHPINNVTDPTNNQDAATKKYVNDNSINSVVEDTTPQLGGELDAGSHSIGFTQRTITSSSGSATINWKLSNKATITLTQNVTFTFTAPSYACNLTLKLVQDSTGGRTVTFPSTVKWAGGTAPTLSTAANAIDIISFYFDGSYYYGVASLNFS